MSKRTLMVGQTLPALNAIITTGRNNDPLDLTGLTVKFRLLDSTGTAVVDDNTSHVTIHPTQTFTASASTDLLTCNGHGVSDSDQIVVATSGTLPAVLAASTRYYAVQVTPNSFGLATTPGGQPIDITDAGTGTHTFCKVGSVQYTWQAADVATAGFYQGWFKVFSSSDFYAAPVEAKGVEIEIKGFGA